MYALVKTESSWDRVNWLSVKPQFGEKNPFINLPYIKDGDKVITQSNPCITYLGRKLSLMGKSEEELERVEQVIAQAFDLRNDAIPNFYGNKENLETKMKSSYYSGHYQKFENWLNFYKFPFSASDSVTAGDFPLWEMLDHHEICAQGLGLPSPLKDYPTLTEFYKKFRQLPQLQDYFGSEMYTVVPCNQLFAAHNFSASGNK